MKMLVSENLLVYVYTYRKGYKQPFLYSLWNLSHSMDKNK